MYHVHIIKVANEQPIASSQIALFFENKAFLTYDLPALIPDSAAYSRRCIDRCDFVVMMVGDDYGQTNAAGVSQLHLSYLTATTKRKPVLIFVKKPNENSARRIIDFVSLLQLQNKQNLHYYQHEPVLGQHLANVYEDFVRKVSVKNWTRSKVSVSPLTSFPASIQDLSQTTTALDDDNSNQNLASANVNNAKNTMGSTKTTTTISMNSYSNIQANMTDINSTSNKSAPVGTKVAINDKNPIIINKKSTSASSVVQGRSRQVISAKQAMHIDNTDLLLVDELVINYRAHAYQDGNLSDVSLSTQVRWSDVIGALIRFNGVFSTDTMYRSLNDLMSKYATEAVKKTMPNVHAVSRCQVCQMDFEWICSQLAFNDWIESVSNPIERDTGNKRFWRLTDAVKNELKFLENMG